MASYIPPLQIWQQMTLSCVILLVLTNTMVNGQQRVVPGINPNHYQQAPPQQAYQHPPAPPQQPHQQHIQSPPGHNPQQYQQYQQQAPVHAQPHQQQQQQQQPQFQQHHAPHNHHGQPQQVLNAANINEERAHIQEHMQVPIDTSKMTEQELQFHYFKMHDSDNNNKLDGCELIKSLIHWHEQSNKEQKDNDPNPDTNHVEKIFTDDEFVALIDPILNMDDTSRDGFIDYPEFIRAQQKAQQQQQQQQQQPPQQQNSN